MDIQNVPTPEAKMPEVTNPEMTQGAPKSKLGLFAIIGVVLVTVLGSGIYYFGFAGNNNPPQLGEGAGQGFQGMTKGGAGDKVVFGGKHTGADATKFAALTKAKGKAPTALKLYTIDSRTKSTYFWVDTATRLSDVYDNTSKQLNAEQLVAGYKDGKWVTTNNTVWKSVTDIAPTTPLVAGQAGVGMFVDTTSATAYDVKLPTEYPTTDTDVLGIAKTPDWYLVALAKEQSPFDYNVSSVWNLDPTTGKFAAEMSEGDAPKSSIHWLLFDSTPAKVVAVPEDKKQKAAEGVKVDDTLAITPTWGDTKVTIGLNAKTVVAADASKFKGYKVTYGTVTAEISSTTTKVGNVELLKNAQNGNYDKIEITGLTNGTEYTVGVEMIYTAPDTSKTGKLTVTGKPVGKAAEGVKVDDTLAITPTWGDTKVTIGLNAKTVVAADASKFKGYKVTYGSVTAEVSSTTTKDGNVELLKNAQNGNYDRIEITGLTNGTEYIVGVEMIYTAPDTSKTGKLTVTGKPVGKEADTTKVIKDVLTLEKGSAGDTTLTLAVNYKLGTAATAATAAEKKTAQDNFKGFEVKYTAGGTTKTVLLPEGGGKAENVSVEAGNITISGLINETEYTVVLTALFNNDYTSSSGMQSVKDTPKAVESTTVVLSDNTPVSANVEQGAEDVPFSSFEFTPTKDVSIKNITIALTQSLNSSTIIEAIEVKVDGESVATVTSGNIKATMIVPVPTSPTLNGGSKVDLDVFADISATASVGARAHLDLKQIVLNDGTTDEIIDVSLIGNQMTVIAAAGPVQEAKDPLTVTATDSSATADVNVGDEIGSIFTFKNTSTATINIKDVKFQFIKGPLCDGMGGSVSITVGTEVANGVCYGLGGIELEFWNAFPISAGASVDITPKIYFPPATAGMDVQLELVQVKYYTGTDETALNTIDLTTPVSGKTFSVKALSASLDYGFSSLFDDMLDSLFNLFK